MESFPAQHGEGGQQISVEPANEHTEATPLLEPPGQINYKSPEASWVPPPSFLWIEIGELRESLSMTEY